MIGEAFFQEESFRRGIEEIEETMVEDMIEEAKEEMIQSMILTKIEDWG